jgi:hypothetical protein
LWAFLFGAGGGVWVNVGQGAGVKQNICFGDPAAPPPPHPSHFPDLFTLASSVGGVIFSKVTYGDTVW